MRVDELQLAVHDANEMEADFKDYLLNYYVWDDERVDSNKKRREKDEEDDNNSYDEGANDPRYEVFLRKLKVDDKSYVVEGEENGSPLLIKYEGDSCLDEECDVEPRRKLRSATNQKNRAKHCSQSTPTKATKMLVEGKSTNASESEKTEERDYYIWRQNVEDVGGYCVLKLGGFTVVYEEDGRYSDVKDEYRDGSSSGVEFLGSTFGKEGKPNFLMIEFKDRENNLEKEDDSGCSSDVEILGSSFNKEGNPNFSMVYEGSTSDNNDMARFRQKVITALRKPYNPQEYDRLLQEIEIRRPEKRHLDLRYGRERSYVVNKEGKSYLDHYPGLKRKLLQVPNDKPRCLNLLRGFFVWLKQPGAFSPWRDVECLAIKPGSRAKTSSYHGVSH